MDRYEVKVDKDSGIRDGPNLSSEARYTWSFSWPGSSASSVETMRIVGALPSLD